VCHRSPQPGIAGQQGLQLLACSVSGGPPGI
jgi:hypothetical protein